MPEYGWPDGSGGGGGGGGIPDIGCRIGATADQTFVLLTMAPQAIAFNLESYDTDGMFNPAAPTRITVQTPGKYHLNFIGYAITDLPQVTFIQIAVGGNAIARKDIWPQGIAPRTYAFSMEIGTEYVLRAGQYAEVRLISIAGPQTVVVSANSHSPIFTARRVA